MRIKPNSYDTWLKEMSISSKPHEIVTAAKHAMSFNRSREAHHDIALILAEMYRRDMVGSDDNRIASNITNERYGSVVKAVFNTPLEPMLEYVKKVNPNFSLGNNNSLGFMKSRVKKDGLGFLN